MKEFLRQLWLLTRKNLILTRRSKVWTLFELILPILIILPLTFFLAKKATVSSLPRQSFDAVPLNGDVSDIFRRIEFVTSIHSKWCRKYQFLVAYYAYEGLHVADQLMNELENRFTDSAINVSVLQMNDEDSLLNQLRVDGSNKTSFLCTINRFVGGVIFDHLNMSQKKLHYRIFLPTRTTDDMWYLNQEWDKSSLKNYFKIPENPPYWSSAFLSLQYAIDSLFTNASTSNGYVGEQVMLRRLPEPPSNMKSIVGFLSMSFYLWSLSAWILVVHTARELANERSTVKEFLSVMGLSTPAFYLSHILCASFKCLIVFLVCALPLISKIEPVSISIFLVVLFIYGISAIVFAALISSLFKSPSTVLKVTIIFWVVLLAAPLCAPQVEQILLCTLYSLNPNAALYYAFDSMVDHVNRERRLCWSNMFEDGSFHFTLGVALLMLFFDVVWMFAATQLFDFLFSDSDFTFSKSWLAKHRYLHSSSNRLCTISDNNETDEGLLRTRAGIRVQQLIKVWSATGERAVDEMSLEAYVGQVTVLLGHNGAGKSTTFSVISGLTAPTSGTVLICDLDIQKQRSLCRRNIGLCPQGNALFDRLTVDEHLWFIHGLKGANGSYVSECERLLSILKLDEKSNELAKNLSGGQKRKLCLLMAIIGNSSVVLLDEPTAGMDPGARRDVESLIQSIKVDRTVLLTTHYLDEAELLGDRVAIMAQGRVYCCGTPQFLKKRFGSGYIMTVVVTENADAKEVAETLIQVAVKYVRGATKGDVHGKQFEIVLPKEHQKNFPELFEYLEKTKDELKISSFGLSLNTLEQVFLKVSENADPGSAVDSTNTTISHGTELIQAQQIGRYDGCSLLFAQVRALFMKRILYTLRNWTQLITQLVIPLCTLILMAYLSTMTKKLNSDQERSYSLVTFGPSRIPVKVIKASSVSRTYLNLTLATPGAMVSQLHGNDSLMDWVDQLPKQLPAAGLGAVFKENVTELLFSSRAYHSLPSSLNLFSNARLKAFATDDYAEIRTGLHAYTPHIDGITSSVLLIQPEAVKSLIGPFLVVFLALLTSAFVVFLVNERVSKFAYQQMLTGISPVTFWATSFLHDFLFFSVICSCFLVVFLIMGWMQGYLHFVILLFILYFWSCVPFLYAVSFIYSSPSKANVLLFLWQMVAAFAAMFIIHEVAVAMKVDGSITEFVQKFLLCLVPSFALGSAFMAISGKRSLNVPPHMLWEWDKLGKNMAFMFIFGCISTFLFVSFQFKALRFRWHQIWDRRFLPRNYEEVGTDEEDSAVLAERMHVEQGGEDLAVEVKDLCKMYGQIKALDKLTMGVRNGECFGLLGVSGAGKTTTFDILTGQSFATSGTAFINKQDVKEQIPIGYCPQFDALMLDFTGRENLEILALMHGFPNAAELAELLLQNVGMVEHADKLTRYYSGGQRRKISTALALLAPTRVVILDEPTAGVDPKARREIWDVLSMIRDKSQSALLLTSHSMDECEALCSRIAILQKGRMIAIGSSQQLKTKFGNNYSITMVAPSLEVRSDVIEGVMRTFPSAVLKTPKESLSLSLKWQIPKTELDRWSSLFRKVQSLATSLGVVDFCVTQPSLEETFLQISSLTNKDLEEDSTQS